LKGTSDGSVVPAGVYTAELTATPSAGDPVSATTRVTVDTEAPRLARADAAPASFSPNGDGQAETVSVSYSPSEACAVRVGILDADGDVVRWLHGWRTREAREYSLTWDGRVSSGGGLVTAPDGDYRFDVERRDAAGNIGRRGVPITLDRTLGHPVATPVTISPDGDGVRDAAVLEFTLTRKAAVTVRILVGGDVVRTLALGDLGAGARTATWDGRTGSGEYLASSRPTFTITAVSAIGASSAGKGLVVDLYRPRLYATSAKATTAGTATKLGFKAVDPFSAKVDVSYVVTDSKGRRVASGHPGWVLTGQGLSATWRPASRGVFTVTYRAVDRGGNHEASSAQTTVTVR
jgi:flagellar hook assembly protein FlgD